MVYSGNGGYDSGRSAPMPPGQNGNMGQAGPGYYGNPYGPPQQWNYQGQAPAKRSRIVPEPIPGMPKGVRTLGKLNVLYLPIFIFACVMIILACYGFMMIIGSDATMSLAGILMILLMIVVLAMDAFTGATLGAVVLPLNLICTIIGVSNLFVTIAIYVVGLVFAFFFGREFLRAKKRSWFVFVIVYAMALIYYAAVLIFSILEITSMGDLGWVMMINIIVYVVPLTFDALILFYLTRPKVRAFFSVGNVAAANPAAPQQAMCQTGYYQPQSPYGYQAPQGQRYAPVPGAQRNMNPQGAPMRQRPPQQPRPQPAAPANPEKTVKYPGGEIFTGKVYNGMPSSGKMQYSNGVVYTGDFDSNGKYSGHGIIEWPNGDSFEGDFVNGVYSGYGRYDSADGSWTKGRYEDGKLNGTATVFVSSNEYTYEGVAENGVFTGEVSIEHDGVCVYEGLVSGYKPSGKGTMYVSGGRIEGMWTGFDYVQGRFYGTDGIVMDVVLGKDDFTGPYERL